MRGADAVLEGLDKERLRVSKLIDLSRLPEEKGQKLLCTIIEARDLAQSLCLQNTETEEAEVDEQN